MAAIGMVQLERFDEFSQKRKSFARLYDFLFKNNKRIKPLLRDYDSVVPHIYVVKIRSKLSIDEIRNKMLEFNIQTGIHYCPNHLLTFYNNGQSLKVTEKVFQNIITLPLHTKLSTDDIRLVASKLDTLINKLG